MVFKMYVEPFETIFGSIKFKIGKGMKNPYLHSEVIRKCPKFDSPLFESNIINAFTTAVYITF